MDILSVGQVARVLTGVLEAEPRLRLVCVRGELANCKAHPSGHFYFTLRDEDAQLRGVMFRSRFRRVAFRPRDGDMVLVTGQVSFYPQAGQVQLYAEALEQLGLGLQLLRLQELKDRLQAEGLFDEARKRPLPVLPRRVGVVTSAAGAALKDIIQVARRRHPAQDLVVSPARVQGDGAAWEIVQAIHRLERLPGVDVIIVGRGGGGQEDLSAFNDEAVVRAVARCNVPVVSAVGHEVDFTLVDFAADRRAPTPSAAAEMAVPVYLDLSARVSELRRRAEAAVRRSVEQRRHRLQSLRTRPPLRRPEELVRRRRDRLMHSARLMAHLGRAFQARRRARLETISVRLQGLDPGLPLRRGYALVLREGRIVPDAGGLHSGDDVELRLRDGGARAKIASIWQEG